jgi:opacity protein-like surface antigen
MKTSCIAFIIVLFLVNIAVSQPRWQFSLTGGYSMPVSDLKGTFPDTIGQAGSLDFTQTKTYLVNKGFSVGIIAKYTMDTTANTKITGGFGYNSFSESKDYSRPSGTLRTYSNKLNILSITAGAEYDISPKKKVNPFVGLEIAANFFSGKIEGTGDTTFSLSRKSENRFGINANAGIDVKIKNNFSLLFGLKYCLNNLFGKQYDQSTVTSGTTDTGPSVTGGVPTELPLNDGNNGAIQSKSINHLQFYAGISLSFGKTK